MAGGCFRFLAFALPALLCLAGGGCMSRRSLQFDAQNPAVRVSVSGLMFGEAYVKAAEVPEILDDYDVPRNRVIHIFLDKEVKDLREARFLMAVLARAGYTRSVLVTKRHSEAINLGKKKSAFGSTGAAAPSGGKIRYKRAGE